MDKDSSGEKHTRCNRFSNLFRHKKVRRGRPEAKRAKHAQAGSSFDVKTSRETLNQSSSDFGKKWEFFSNSKTVTICDIKSKMSDTVALGSLETEEK